MSTEEMPRERLYRLGAKALADEDLLAILLGSGIRGKSVFNLAREVSSALDSGEIDALKTIRGLGDAKLAALQASLEYARRRWQGQNQKIRQPSDVVPLVMHLLDRRQEIVVSVSLNGALEVIQHRVVTVGLLNSCQVHPREVFSDILIDRAYAVILIHNHPSGSLEPSAEDRAITDRMKAAAELLGIRFLDHLIVNRVGFYSFQEEQSYLHVQTAQGLRIDQKFASLSE